MHGFEELGFPNCVGAMDGCHIPIRAPHGKAIEYKKSFFSVLLQGTVDHTGRFMDVAIGHSGMNDNAHVLRCSPLCDAMDAGRWVPGNPTITIDGVQVPPLILADATYPMRKWLVTPYTGTVDQRQACFNRYHSGVRSMVERAFRRLKARWCCLALRLPVGEENIIPVISSCVILHNVCEQRGHNIVCPPGAPGPIRDPQPTEPPSTELEKRHLEEGGAVREALANWFMQHGRY